MYYLKGNKLQIQKYFKWQCTEDIYNTVRNTHENMLDIALPQEP
jgi:hypothetical protein